MNKYALSAGDLINELASNLSASDLKEALCLSDIAFKICHKRISMGMSQKEFADYLGVSQGMVSRWENGDYNFTVATLCNLCCKLGLDLDIQIHDSSSSYYPSFNPQIVYGGISDKQYTWNNTLEVC